MKILVTSTGYIIYSADSFSFGTWEEADTFNGVIVHKWKAEDENGTLLGYIIDENMNAINGSENPSCQSFEVEAFPTDYTEGKYLYIDGNFTVNPDWTEPEPTVEERIAELEATVLASDEAVVSLYEMQLSTEEINIAQDEAITGLYEIMLA